MLKNKGINDLVKKLKIIAEQEGKISIAWCRKNIEIETTYQQLNHAKNAEETIAKTLKQIKGLKNSYSELKDGNGNALIAAERLNLGCL